MQEHIFPRKFEVKTYISVALLQLPVTSTIRIKNASMYPQFIPASKNLYQEYRVKFSMNFKI